MKRVIGKKMETCIGLGFLILTATQSMAAVTVGSWYLNQSNVFTDGVNYAEVDIVANSLTGKVEFTVIPFDVYTSTGMFYGIQNFGFNYQNVTSAPNTWTLNLPLQWSQSTNMFIDGFGLFLVTENGLGISRKDPLEFSITLPNHAEAIASNFAAPSSILGGGKEVFFAAHIAGFTMSGYVDTSHFVGGSSPVPEPCTILISLIGLCIFGWLKRRLS
jgi:hypothetical protein